jgi:hypothetical protein
VTSHDGQPATLFGPRTSDAPSRSTNYAYHDSIQEQYTTQSVFGYIPLSNCGSWHNPPTLHNHSPQNDPVLGGTGASAMGNNYYWPSHPFPMYALCYYFFLPSHPPHRQYPDVCPEMHIFDSLLYDEPSDQQQNFAIFQTGPLTSSVPPMTPPLWAAESLQTSPSSQKSHDQTICYPSDHLPIANHPYSIQLRSHLSPLLLSCRWLYDDALCEFMGTLEELKAHCKISHFYGLQTAQVQCRWEACAYRKRGRPTVYVMRRDCMWRHTCEVHLGMKRGA